MSERFFWTTMDGRRLDVRWMDSLHLVRSFNMAARSASLTQAGIRARCQARLVTGKKDTFTAMLEELDKRGWLAWLKNANQLITTGVPRETPAQLALLRAILDAGSGAGNLAEAFRTDPQATLNWVLDRPEEYPEIIAKFTEYRMAQA